MKKLVKFASDIGHDRRWNGIVDVLEDAAKRLGVEIVVSYHDGGEFIPPKIAAKKLFLRVFATPLVGAATATRRTSIDTVFGCDAYVEEVFQPSAIGHRISDENGTTFAEIIGGTLYILGDLLYCNDSEQIIQHIMDEYCKVTADIGERKKQEADRLEQARINSWQNFIELFRIGQDRLEQPLEEIKLRFDRLMETSGGSNKVLVVEGEIRVVTNKIERTLRGVLFKRNIGKYLVSICPDEDDEEVLLTCVEPTEHTHPHAYETDSYCFGNANHGLQRFAVSKDFELLMELMLEFLRKG